MKSLLLFALLFTLAFAEQCTYPTQDDTAYYIYESTWLNTTDSNGNIWFFQSGCFGFTDFTPCPENSPACVLFSGSSEPVSAAIQTPEDGYSYTANGLEFVFSSETSCYSNSVGEKTTMKTTLDFNCDPLNDNITFSVSFEGCFTVITVNSSSFCPISSMDESGDYPSYADFGSENSIAIQYVGFAFFSIGIILLFSIGFLISVCLCCCCMVRRRRQKKMQVAMRQFSNVAFQPIPNSKATRQPTPISNHVPQGPLPAYNPYLGQPQQFVYYYPAQVPQGQPSMVPLQNFGDSNKINDSDEKFAKELQAQYDRENQV